MSAMSAGATVVEQPEHCWCCGSAYASAELHRLGSHPEVGICATCARWLWRRARQSQDLRAHGVAPMARRGLFRARERIIAAGIHRWPVLGRVLRWIDRRLP